MHEIKFRGWDAEIKQMWDWYELMNTHPLGCLYTHHDLSWVVMQYTGLKDKNGKEIYEGDIVEEVGDQHYLWIVEWNQDDCCFDVRDQFSDTFFDTVDLNAIFRHGEVIGNIYENPELLEGNK